MHFSTHFIVGWDDHTCSWDSPTIWYGAMQSEGARDWVFSIGGMGLTFMTWPMANILPFPCMSLIGLADSETKRTFTG